MCVYVDLLVLLVILPTSLGIGHDFESQKPRVVVGMEPIKVIQEDGSFCSIVWYMDIGSSHTGLAQEML